MGVLVAAGTAVVAVAGVGPIPRAAAEKSCAAGDFHALGSPRVAYAAVVKSRAYVYRRPGGALLRKVGRRNVNGVPWVLGIVGFRVDGSCKRTFYEVQVAMRPNGTTGWVRARAVSIHPVTARIDVDVSRRRLTLFRDGGRVLDARVAVGAPATPTPTGRFYVNQRLVPTNPYGPYGPGAIGISAFSNVLTGWAQGGPVAIHGTNAPWSIGRAVSNGCIRLQNPVLRRVFRVAVAGTPVVIHA